MGTKRSRKPAVFAVFSLVILFGGSLATLWLPADDQVFGVIAVVAGYVYCGGCALSRWHADDRVFEHPSWKVVRHFVVTVAIVAQASVASGQPAIAHLTTDALNRGSLSAEIGVP